MSPASFGDSAYLLTARALRLFAFGLVAVILALHLTELGFDDAGVGLLLTLTLAGDAILSLLLSTRADRIGRRRTLKIGALLMAGAGLTFAASETTWIIALAAIAGTISPSGNEVGTFLAVEQAGISQLVSDKRRTVVFARYTLTGYVAAGLGSLFAGMLAQALTARGIPTVAIYRVLMLFYGCIGIALFVLYGRVSGAVETTAVRKSSWGIHRSRSIVKRLSALFAVDAFAGGLIVQSWIAYWLTQRFDVGADALGMLFFGTSILSGFSVIAAARIAQRFGLIRTMVFSHLPSNILLMSIPLMPTFELAALLLLIRACLSQMDVPTRQSYVMAVVAPDERSAAAGITGTARTAGTTAAPVLSGILAQLGAASIPFFASGALKIVYDLSLYRSFRRLRPPEELP